jgi:serine/threonine-protein kinase RsbW
MTAAADPDAVRRITLAADFASLETVRAFVAQAARDGALREAEVYAVQLAVDEAFTNIIEHAYQGESPELVECTCQVGGDRLTITLRDCGAPFNPWEIPDPDLDASLEDRTAGGLGLFFMRQMMDEVHFEFIPATADQRGCNILTMSKRRGSRPGRDQEGRA